MESTEAKTEVIYEDENIKIEGEAISEEETGSKTEGNEETGSKEEDNEENGSNRDTDEETAEEASSEDEDGSSGDIVEEEFLDNVEEMIAHMAYAIIEEFEAEVSWSLLTDQIKHTVMEIAVDNRIQFRQIIDLTLSVKENCERIIGSYERNLRVYDKLSQEYMTKYGQEIMFMDQTEVKSIKTVKEVDPPKIK